MSWTRAACPHTRGRCLQSAHRQPGACLWYCGAGEQRLPGALPQEKAARAAAALAAAATGAAGATACRAGEQAEALWCRPPRHSHPIPAITINTIDSSESSDTIISWSTTTVMLNININVTSTSNTGAKCATASHLCPSHLCRTGDSAPGWRARCCTRAICTDSGAGEHCGKACGRRQSSGAGRCARDRLRAGQHHVCCILYSRHKAGHAVRPV